MGNFYYNLCGGLNTQLTPIQLGADVKKLFWADAFNVEPYKNQGIASQKGNRILLELAGVISPREEENPDIEPDSGILDAENDSVEQLSSDTATPLISEPAHADLSAVFALGVLAYPKGSESFLLALSDGRIFHVEGALVREIHDFGAEISACLFEYFLDGVAILPKTRAGQAIDGVFYNPEMKGLVDALNFKNADGEPISGDAMCQYAGRLWISSSDTLYYSALGTYNDWTSAHDAGYISKFHSSTSEILALKEYGGSLAIYKRYEVFLLTGTDPESFAISKFADKGAAGPDSVLTCNNRQYFFNDCGLFSLSLTGELNQIVMSQNRAQNIAKYFEKLDVSRLSATVMLALESKNQIWIFAPIRGETGQKEVWIYDYLLECWFTRIIPYEITTATTVAGEIYTVCPEDGGKIFVENKGNTFSGKAVRFSFSTPFFNFSRPTDLKIVENFEMLLDGGFENNFDFFVSTDYMTENRTQPENVHTFSPNTLVWVGNAGDVNAASWAGEGVAGSGIWTDNLQEGIKLDIFEANKAVQLHFQGNKAGQDIAIIGFEFKEIIYEQV